jgi:phage-related protein
MSGARKPLHFVGSSHEDLKTFPDEARRDAGFNLDAIQRGLEPENWKPMSTVGTSVKEIRVRDPSGAFRVIYLAARPEEYSTAFRRRPKRQARGISTWPNLDSRQ